MSKNVLKKKDKIKTKGRFINISTEWIHYIHSKKIAIINIKGWEYLQLRYTYIYMSKSNNWRVFYIQWVSISYHHVFKYLYK